MKFASLQLLLVCIPALFLSGCTTTTTTHPDGTVVTVRTSDPKTIKAITNLVGKAAAAGIAAEIEASNQR